MAEPVIRFLHLIPVLDDLAEDPVIVPDPVSESRQFQCSHGIQETGGKTPQTSIAQSGIIFLFPEDSKIKSQFFHRLPDLGKNIQTDQGIAQGSAHKEFQRNIIDRSGQIVVFIHIPCGNQVLHDQIPDA